ncbi:MAG: ABC transporter substrate-binding protein [Acidimicrobiales bacterium]
MSVLVSSCALLPSEEGAIAPANSVLAKVEFAEIEGEVRIGVVLDLSGEWQSVEAPMVAAVAARVKAHNGSGGVAGERLGLEVLDGQNDSDLTIDAVEALIGRGARVILMGCETETVIPAAQVANDRGVLVMTPCITADGFAAEVGDLGFSAGVPDSQQGIVLADRAIAVGAIGAITVSDVSDESTHARCRSFSERFSRSGGDTSATIEFGEGGVSLDRLAATLGQFIPPDVVVVCAAPQEVAAAVSEVRRVRPEGLILLGTEADTEFWTEGTPFSGIEFITTSSLHGRQSAADGDFIAQLETPPTASVQMVAAALIDLFVDSSTALGTVDPPLIAESLPAMSTDRFLIATLSYDADHLALWSRLGIVHLENGLPSLVDLYDPSNPPVPPPPTSAFVATTEAPSQ